MLSSLENYGNYVEHAHEILFCIDSFDFLFLHNFRSHQSHKNQTTQSLRWRQLVNKPCMGMGGKSGRHFLCPFIAKT